ncbi:MAG: PEP-utilizing enzyme, partial [Actinomycetota bacterium]|nr:PEP-utilizing enzyme [Actinomycetota bacterium]
VVVQHMVLGVEGLASSRNLFDGQTLPVLADGLEPHRDELVPMLRAGEVALRDAVEFNVVASPAGLVVLNGGVALRSGVAAVRIAHALVSDPEVVLSREEAIGRINEHHIEQLLHHSFDDASALAVLATGLGASPGAATGVVAFSADEAVAFAAAGDQVILVAQETSPEDVHGMEVAAGILTSRGGLASHAAVVARGWGTPAVCGAEEVVIGDEMFVVGDTMVAKGDRISIDGSTGIVMLGEASTSSAEPPAEFEEILGWADEIRAGRLAVRANADTGADAAQARTFGAEGIGLCRTEHMFLAKDRLPIVRDMILATSPARERAALTRLRLAQRDDFLPILEAMDGLPVTVRLLDPPLHEFLPDLDELLVADAKGELDEAGAQLLAAARAWSEQNPMIGTRGVRLGWLKPGLYEMQVRALVEAVAERVAAGGDPVVEVMIPLTVSAPELAGARGWIDDALAGDGSEAGRITVGTMIETPRAALVAGSLASHADFFSFGTNDLTQLTYGFSRDDVETSIMGLYLENDLLPSNPFEHLDIEAVAELVNIGAERGRATKPGLKLGICGEHGGDPQSIAVCLAAGLDYVSCSPYRVPVARLAAAQAVISERSR